MKKTALMLALLLALPLAAADAKDAKKASCCAKGEKSAAAKDAKCDHEKTAAATGAKCTAQVKSDVILTGKLLCEHCNLHKTEKCSAVFQAEGRDGYLSVCPETKDIEKLKGIGEHGKATVEVKGTLCKGADGKEMLMITSCSKKA